MRVSVNVSIEGVSVNEAFEGANEDEIVGKMKARVARELSFPLRMGLSAMSNTMFGQEVVRRYNAYKKLSLPLPADCKEFLSLAEQHGLAKIG
ncbi:MAG TPA: hypothetical protein VKT77_09020 [Chthonomonadaceae bacterium]|nr:hypothetical protein [Chthonomonadaceae bacterium]